MRSPPTDQTPLAVPHDLGLEQSLLGALLMRNDAIDDLAELRPEHFFDPLHGQLFAAMERTIRAQRPASPMTVGPQFASHGPVGSHKDATRYLGALAAQAVGVDVGGYGRLLVDLSTRRRLIVLAEEARAAAFDRSNGLTARELVEGLEASLAEVAPKALGEARAVTIAQAMAEAIEASNEVAMRGGGLAGMPTGSAALDDITGGLVDGALIVLAGRPSMGKSALAQNIVARAAKRNVPALFVSMEMPAKSLGTRALAADTKLSIKDIDRGKATEAEMRQLMQAQKDAGSEPLTVLPASGMTVARLRAEARRLRRKGRCDLIVVDYLQLMRPARALSNRVQEITEITTGLKALAMELGVPIIALSQLSRQVEQREDKRPQLSDLRESGSIEQDADVVMFVFREEYYVEREKPDATKHDAYAEWLKRLRAVEGRAEVIVAKNRQGPLGTAALKFDGATASFSDAEGAP